MSAHSSGVAFSLRSRSLACGRLRSPAVACGRLRSPAVACLRTQWRQKAAISPRFGWTGDFYGLRSACVGCLGCLGDCEKRRAVLFVLQDVFGPLLGIFTRRRRRERKTYDATTATTTRTAERPPRPAAAAIPQPPLPLVTALHLAAPPGRRTSLLSPVSAGSAITVTVPIATAPRVTSRRVASACARMT